MKRAVMLALMLGACGTVRVQAPKVDSVPVPVSCVPKEVPPQPDPNSYPDTRDKLLALDGPAMEAAIWDGNRLKSRRLDVLEPTVAGCR